MEITKIKEINNFETNNDRNKQKQNKLLQVTVFSINDLLINLQKKHMLVKLPILYLFISRQLAYLSENVRRECFWENHI